MGVVHPRIFIPGIHIQSASCPARSVAARDAVDGIDARNQVDLIRRVAPPSSYGQGLPAFGYNKPLFFSAATSSAASLTITPLLRLGGGAYVVVAK